MISAAVNVITILILSGAVKHPYLFKLRRHFNWNRAALKSYFHKCFPILMNEILIGVGNMVINVVLGRQSEEAIAATAVFRTLEGLLLQRVRRACGQRNRRGSVGRSL